MLLALNTEPLRTLDDLRGFLEGSLSIYSSPRPGPPSGPGLAAPCDGSGHGPWAGRTGE